MQRTVYRGLPNGEHENFELTRSNSDLIVQVLGSRTPLRWPAPNRPLVPDGKDPHELGSLTLWGQK